MRKGLNETVELGSPVEGWRFTLSPDWVGSGSVHWVIYAPSDASTKKRLGARAWVEQQIQDMGLICAGGRWA